MSPGKGLEACKHAGEVEFAVFTGVKRRKEKSTISKTAGVKGLIMASKKDSGTGGVLLTPLLGLKARKSDKVDGSNSLHNSMPSICYLPSRSSKTLLGLERESVENATVSLHQVRQTIVKWFDSLL